MRSRSTTFLLLLVVLLVWVQAALSWWFVSDDAYISFRYGRMLASGHGLRFNIGETPPVEGYSNFLWVILAAIAEVFGTRPDVVLPWVSLASGAVLIGAVHHAMVDRLGVPPLAALIGAVALAADPGTVVWATGGLATMPAALLIYGLFERWVLSESREDDRVGGLYAVLLLLLRTEGLGWVVVCGVLAVLVRRLERPGAHRDWGPLLRAWVDVVLATVVYGAWRYATYGALLSNTASAKVGFSMERFERGWDYLVLYELEALTPLLWIALAPLAWRRAGAKGLAITAMAVGVPLYALLVGGDFMTMGRLLVPGHAFGAMLLALALAEAHRSGRAVALPAMLGALGAIAVGTLPLYDIQLVPDELRKDYRVRFNTRAFRTEAKQWQFMRNNAVHWLKQGEALAQVGGPGDSVVLGAIGAASYPHDLHVYDRFGLVTREVAQREGESARRHSPGHDKAVPATWFLGEAPTFLWSDVLLQKGSLRRAPMEVAGWRSKVAGRPYGPDLQEVVIDGEPAWLLSIRRVDDPEAAWEGLDARIRELQGRPAPVEPEPTPTVTTVPDDDDEAAAKKKKRKKRRRRRRKKREAEAAPTPDEAP